MAKDDWFEYFIKGMDKEMQAQLRFMYAHKQIQDEFDKKREREQLKKEIIAEVLAHISVSIDISEVIASIKEIQDELNKLGK